MNEIEELKFSEKLDEWNKAYAKFQAMHVSVKKDSENPHFRSTYASLPAVLESCREGLALSNFTILQLPLGGVEVCRLLTRISHSSGQFVQWISTTPISKKDPQGIGSGITYLRRFNITSSLGLSELDDDGHEASRGNIINVPEENKSYNEPIQKTAYKDSSASAAKGPSVAQIKRLYEIIKQAGYSPEEIKAFIKEQWGLGSFEQLDWKKYRDLCGDKQKGISGLIPSRQINTAPPLSDNSYADNSFDSQIPF